MSVGNGNGSSHPQRVTSLGAHASMAAGPSSVQNHLQNQQQQAQYQNSNTQLPHYQQKIVVGARHYHGGSHHPRVSQNNRGPFGASQNNQQAAAQNSKGALVLNRGGIGANISAANNNGIEEQKQLILVHQQQQPQVIMKNNASTSIVITGSNEECVGTVERIQSKNRPQQQHYIMKKRVVDPSFLPERNVVANNIGQKQLQNTHQLNGGAAHQQLEESCDSNPIMVSGHLGVAAANATKFNQSNENYYQSTANAGEHMVTEAESQILAAGLSTKDSRKSQQSTRRRNVNNLQQSFVSQQQSAQHEAGLDEILQISQQLGKQIPEREKIRLSMRMPSVGAEFLQPQIGNRPQSRQSNDPQRSSKISQNFQKNILEQQRGSLPPIGTSPNQRYKHNSSGTTGIRKKVKSGLPEIFAQGVPNSTKAINQKSQSLHGDRMRTNRVGGDGKIYRKSSNHTQLITKKKTASLFDVVAPNVQIAHQSTRRSEANFHGIIDSNQSIEESRRRQGPGRINSVKRTSNDNLVQARQGYYACQCIRTGKHESNRIMSYFECPDHLPGPGTTAQLKSARNQQNLKPFSSIKREAVIINGKTQMIKSAANAVGLNQNANNKQQQQPQYLAAANHAFGNPHPHETERFVQACVIGNPISVEQQQQMQQRNQQMGKTHLTVVGNSQQFTPQKPSLRKTFQQDGNNLNNKIKRGKFNLPIQKIPAEDVKFFDSNSNEQGRKNQKKLAKLSKNPIFSSVDDAGALANAQKNQSATVIPHQESIAAELDRNDSNGNSINEEEPLMKDVRVYTVNRLMKESLRMNDSSEKVPLGRRVSQGVLNHNSGGADGLGSSSQENDHFESSAEYNNTQQVQSKNEDSEHTVSEHHHNQDNIYIKENRSSLQSIEQKVQQKMHLEREMYLDKIRRKEDEKDMKFESPGKTINLKQDRSSQGIKLSPYSSGKVIDVKIKQQFTMSKIDSKLQTEIKIQGSPEAQQPDLYPMNNKLRQNIPLAVPANSLVKEAQVNKDKVNSSPMMVRISTHSSNEKNRPKLYLNVRHCKQSDNSSVIPHGHVADDCEASQEEQEVKQLNLDDESGENLIIQKVQQSNLESDSKIQNQITDQQQTEESKEIVIVSNNSEKEPPIKKYLQVSQPQNNIVYDYDQAQCVTPRDDVKMSPRSGSDFDSPLSSSKNQLHHMNSSQAQLERSLRMGDVTNSMARQQSHVEMNKVTDERALSYKFKNHRVTVNTNRGLNGEILSNEDCIPSDMASEMLNDNSDEHAMSQGLKFRASGRDFSCIFDADSEGPKQDKGVIQINQTRQIELQTVKRGQKLGEGSFGQVYQGLYDGAQSEASGSFESDENMKNMLPPQMAIKVVRVENELKQSKLEAELELLSTLQHDHIVQYYGCLIDKEKNEASIFMELMPHSLQFQYKNFGPLHERVIKRHTKQILEALHYLHNHEQRIIHMDLKAANILSDSGCTKLTDFGDSRKLESLPQDYHISAESGALFTELKGSILWMAPECLARKPVGRRSDIWSLGCTLIELASARHPWHGINEIGQLFQKFEIQEIPQIPESLSAQAKDFISQCLTYDKDLRPTAQQLMSHAFVNESAVQPTQQKQMSAAVAQK